MTRNGCKIAKIKGCLFYIEMEYSSRKQELVEYFSIFFLLPTFIKYWQYTWGPLLTLFFKTLEKKTCKQKTVKAEE